MKALFALHSWPALPAGHMGVRVGPIMASANRFQIWVRRTGASATVTIKPGYQSTVNHRREARLMARVMAEVAGEANAMPTCSRR